MWNLINKVIEYWNIEPTNQPSPTIQSLTPWWESNASSPNLEFASLIKKKSITQQDNMSSWSDYIPESVKKNHCRFYGSASGCKYGSKCKKGHNYPELTMICRFWGKSNLNNNGCRYGNKCKYRHFLTEDEILNDKLWSMAYPSVPSPFSNQSKSILSCNIIKTMDTKSVNFENNLLKLFKQNENKILFHIKKRIVETWDDDIDVIIEGYIMLNNKCNKLQLMTQQILIHKTTEYDGDTLGGNYNAPTTKIEKDYVIQKYWINDLENSFLKICNDVTPDIIAEILVYVGFPVFYKAIICLIMDCFCYETQIEEHKIDNVWNHVDTVLVASFGKHFHDTFESMKRLIDK